MNATAININPANAAQPPAPGKQQDSAAQDVPFSQVLASEMAQNKRNSSEAAKQDADAKGSDGAPRDARVIDDATTRKPEADAAATDALNAPVALGAPVAEDASALPTAATLLGAAITPDQLKPEPATKKEAGLLSTTGAVAVPIESARKGRVAQGRDLTENARETQKADLALSGNAAPQAAKTAALASAFSGQLAAARQADLGKPGEFGSELLSNPAMRAPSQASFEVLHALTETASSKLSPTVGSTAWNQALGDKVVWMAAGAQQTATLTLNPPNMGPLQIVLNLSNEQATASFFSAQPEVRQALEAAFPRLKEMMNEAGIQLEQATVSADTPRQHNSSDRQAHPSASAFTGAETGITSGAQALHVPVQQSGRGLIDTFA